MKTKLLSIVIVSLIFSGISCQKKDPSTQAKINQLKKEAAAAQVVADKELELKVATVKAGKDLPTPVNIISSDTQKVSVQEMPRQSVPVQVEIVKPIPTQAIPATVVQAPKPAQPVKVAQAPKLVQPETPKAATSVTATSETKKEEPQSPPSLISAPTPPPASANLADSLGAGGKK